MSPYPMASEGGDDMPVESPEDLLFAFASPTPSQMGAQLSKSPTSNKRYRTHLTPLQVHMMKCVFADYKTPSMTECEVLGKEIGLHKRVVQVWFQVNERLKGYQNVLNFRMHVQKNAKSEWATERRSQCSERKFLELTALSVESTMEIEWVYK